MSVELVAAALIIGALSLITCTALFLSNKRKYIHRYDVNERGRSDERIDTYSCCSFVRDVLFFAVFALLILATSYSFFIEIDTEVTLVRVDEQYTATWQDNEGLQCIDQHSVYPELGITAFVEPIAVHGDECGTIIQHPLLHLNNIAISTLVTAPLMCLFGFCTTAEARYFDKIVTEKENNEKIKSKKLNVGTIVRANISRCCSRYPKNGVVIESVNTQKMTVKIKFDDNSTDDIHIDQVTILPSQSSFSPPEGRPKVGDNALVTIINFDANFEKVPCRITDYCREFNVYDVVVKRTNEEIRVIPEFITLVKPANVQNTIKTITPEQTPTPVAPPQPQTQPPAKPEVPCIPNCTVVDVRADGPPQRSAHKKKLIIPFSEGLVSGFVDGKYSVFYLDGHEETGIDPDRIIKVYDKTEVDASESESISQLSSSSSDSSIDTTTDENSESINPNNVRASIFKQMIHKAKGITDTHKHLTKEQSARVHPCDDDLPSSTKKSRARDTQKTPVDVALPDPQQVPPYAPQQPQPQQPQVLSQVPPPVDAPPPNPIPVSAPNSKQTNIFNFNISSH